MIERKTFEESLMSPLQFWNNKSKTQVRHLLGNETAQMVKYDQRNPHHCFTLFSHCLHTVQELSKEAPISLRIAAFFHDIGKPYVAQEKQGRLVFYGHAAKSAEITIKILKNLGYSDQEVNRICFYIRHHDDFISWVLPTESYDHENPYLVEITTENVATHIEKNNISDLIDSPYILWANLLDLCSADASAQADTVYKDGVIIDTKQHKLKKVDEIKMVLEKMSYKV